MPRAEISPASPVMSLLPPGRPLRRRIPAAAALRRMWGRSVGCGGSAGSYGRAELRWLLIGVVMRAGELAADLAAPWPLALGINDLLQGRQHSSPLHGVAQLFAMGWS